MDLTDVTTLVVNMVPAWLVVAATRRSTLPSVVVSCVAVPFRHTVVPNTVACASTRLECRW